MCLSHRDLEDKALSIAETQKVEIYIFLPVDLQ